MWRNINRLSMAAAMSLAITAHIGPTSATAAELVVYGSKDCAVSQTFHREIAADYAASKGGRVFPLRQVDIEKGDAGIVLERPVTLTPTFVFVDEGRERARFTGYPGRAHFFLIIDAAVNAFVEREPGS